MDEEKLAHELQVLSNFFTQHLKGQQLSDIAELDCSGLDKAFQHYAETLTRALKALVRRVCEPAPTQFVISGLSEVLRQPEFSDSQQIQAIVQLLEEEQAQLWPLLFESPSPLKGRRVRVWIGSENPIEPMQSCALVVPLTFFYCLSVRNTRAKFHVFITIYTIVTISRVSRLDNSDLSRKE